MNGANDIQGVERLTLRQRQVYQLVTEGKSSRQIAATLNISQRTVEHHRRIVMAKMGRREQPRPESVSGPVLIMAGGTGLRVVWCDPVGRRRQVIIVEEEVR